MAAVACTREASDDFVGALTGTLAVPAFFDAESTERIIREAGHGVPS